MVLANPNPEENNCVHYEQPDEQQLCTGYTIFEETRKLRYRNVS